MSTYTVEPYDPAPQPPEIRVGVTIRLRAATIYAVRVPETGCILAMPYLASDWRTPRASVAWSTEDAAVDVALDVAAAELRAALADVEAAIAERRAGR